MAKKGVALVPTDLSKNLFYKYLEASKIEKDKDLIYGNYQKEMSDRLQRAIKAKVTILTGSDNYLNFEIPQGAAAKEILIAYQEEGMKPLQILKSSTYLSAKFMNMEDRIGVFKKGAYADIIAVKGDVVKNFSSAMFNVVFVMKDGKIYVDRNEQLPTKNKRH
ncbi:amidohydrolase family protein [Xanthovirga aplysinae]|uniref:amidohydrolase family protein n=1 Tax=Xanthovirga aplysinae TaxID=2529853 RepID=UPI001656B7C8|nr:amidohydrolase family protein [Xanthovirga aplysinae]